MEVVAVHSAEELPSDLDQQQLLRILRSGEGMFDRIPRCATKGEERKKNKIPSCGQRTLFSSRTAPRFYHSFCIRSYRRGRRLLGCPLVVRLMPRLAGFHSLQCFSLFHQRAHLLSLLSFAWFSALPDSHTRRLSLGMLVAPWVSSFPTYARL